MYVRHEDARSALRLLAMTTWKYAICYALAVKANESEEHERT